MNAEALVRADLINVRVMYDHGAMVPHWSRVQNHLRNLDNIQSEIVYPHTAVQTILF